MKRAMITLLGLILAGCSTKCPTDDNRLGVQAKGPHENMFVAASGQKAWYSALEFENLARDYVRSNKIDFDFTDTQTTIWISTCCSDTLAEVWFSSSAFSRPALCVRIGRKGQVLGHTITPTACRECIKIN